jgi:tetratricopeptide (TPR) repeat protein
VYGRDLEIAEEAVKRQPADFTAQRGLGASLLKLGQAYARKGDFSEARAPIERACILRRDLLATAPADPELKRELLIALTQAGSMHLEAHETREAVVHFQTALKLADELCADEPENQNRQRDRALLREQLAVLDQ